jgi:hypothetical protein
MYARTARCGGLDAAVEVFDAMPQRNKVFWNAMVEVCSHGRTDKVIQVFAGIHYARMNPDKVAWLSIPRACTSEGNTRLYRAVHASIED